MWHGSVFEVSHVLLTLVLKVTQSYIFHLSAFFFFFFCSSRINLINWNCDLCNLLVPTLPTVSCKNRTTPVEKPDIFFTPQILVVHRTSYCTFTKIITVQAQLILLPSSTLCLFREKFVQLNGKLTKLH
jgi:hypothetical protein